MAATSIILFADREPNGLLSMSRELGNELSCPVKNAVNSQDLKTCLENFLVDILVIDLEFSKIEDGFSFLGSLKKQHPGTLILPVIPADQPDVLKKILELDLIYFIHKPLDPIETAFALKRAHATLSKQKTVPPPQAIPKTASFHGMIGANSVMQDLFRIITMVADDDIATVLIRGESGTGKEMVAKAIHAESRRHKNNFVPVNCAAIPDDLLESELFGYTKGAFTGATTNKPGRIQYADKGTLFLDEIGDMKASLQAKLLRVLQEKEFEPVGAFKAIPVNTRILAATHCDLEQLVREGTFREDLYYRLSVIPLNIPSLKERSSDIPLLIDTFQEKYSINRGRDIFSFSSQAMKALTHFEWRGNVRELENLIQYMSILYSGKEVGFTDLPEKFQSFDFPECSTEPTEISQNNSHGGIPQSPTDPWENQMLWENGEIDFNELINDYETQLIIQAMKLTEGNKKEAARLLNLKRTTLLEKIKKKNIEGFWEV